MFKKILITLAVIIGVFAVYVSTRPDDYSISRGTSIGVKPAKVYAILNDVHRWNEWSPFAKHDAQMSSSYEGPGTGVGATLNWDSKGETGAGKMCITKSIPSQLVAFQLDFFRPFKGDAQVAFTIRPDGEATSVVWSMSGKYNLISKVMCVFFSMDKMMGPTFESGLLDLKTLAEASNK